jgi:cytoskeletal protein RodZ
MPSATFELGSSIREVRLRHGLTLPHVGEQLGLPAKVLRALEWERFDLVGDDAGAQSALRAYVEYLGLDSDVYLAEYAARMGLSSSARSANGPAVEPRQPIPSPASLVEPPAQSVEPPAQPVALPAPSVERSTYPVASPPQPAGSPAPLVEPPTTPVVSAPPVAPPAVDDEPALEHARPAADGRPAARRRRESTAYLIILLPILAALATTLVLDYFIWSDDPKPPASAGASPQQPDRGSATTAVPTPPSPGAGGSSVNPPPSSSAASPSPSSSETPVQLKVTASRGDSWLVVRSGSIGGRVLFDGLLERGDSFSASKSRLWVRLGAATNVDVDVDGSPPPVDLYGTLDAIVDADGFRKVPLAP